MMSAYETLSGIKNAKDFVVVKDAPSPEEQALIDENEQLKNAYAQMQQQMEQMQQQQAEAEAMKPQTIANKTGVYSDPDVAQAAEILNQ